MTTIEITVLDSLTGITMRHHQTYRWRWLARLMAWHVNDTQMGFDVWTARVVESNDG